MAPGEQPESHRLRGPRPVATPSGFRVDRRAEIGSSGCLGPTRNGPRRNTDGADGRGSDRRRSARSASLRGPFLERCARLEGSAPRILSWAMSTGSARPPGSASRRGARPGGARSRGSSSTGRSTRSSRTASPGGCAGGPRRAEGARPPGAGQPAGGRLLRPRRGQGPRGGRAVAGQGRAGGARRPPLDRRGDARIDPLDGRLLRLLVGPGARRRGAGRRQEKGRDARSAPSWSSPTRSARRANRLSYPPNRPRRWRSSAGRTSR